MVFSSRLLDRFLGLSQRQPTAIGPRSLFERSTTNSSSSSSSSSATESKNPFAAFDHGLNGTDSTSNAFFVDVLVITLGVLIVASFFLRMYKFFRNHMRWVGATGANREYQKIYTRNDSFLGPWLKRYILYSPFLNKRHNKEFKISSAVDFGTLPTRFHGLILLVYVVTNIAYCFILPWTTKPLPSNLANLRGRSGALAVWNMIPLTLCALRNSPLIPILQVSYDTFNLMHRWISRIFVIEAVIHTAAWWIAKSNAGGSKAVSAAFAHSQFIQWGGVGTFVSIAILVQAWSPVRHAFYEVFLNLHKVLAIFVYAGVWIHCQVGNLPQFEWLKLCIALVVLEYVIRIARIAWYNVARQKNTKVSIEALPGETCRVTFDLARPWTFSPGHHVHVYLPRYSWHSSHPFSVAWSEDHVVGNFNEKLPMSIVDLDRAEEKRTSISLIIKARTGVTRAIYDRAAASPTGVLTTFGAIEGPYGGHESLDSYGTVLLFAGGVGITHQIGYIRHLIRGYDEHTTATKKIVLIWSVPNSEALEMVRPWMDEILKMKGRRDVLRIQLFVTKPKTQQEIVSGTRSVTMFPGRCNPQSLIDKEFLAREGAMVVTCCGPGSFADSVRHACRKRVEKGNLDFIEEAFTY